MTQSPALDPIFNATPITNEAGQPDYGFYWSSTTHVSYPNRVSNAAYISFGRAMGYMERFGGWTDVHGAGAQRSDGKAGVAANEALGHGPQGDARRSDNLVRCVRGGSVQLVSGESPATLNLPSSQPPQQGVDQPINQGPPAEGGPPNNQGPGANGSPPPEALTACAGSSDGASCSFQTPRGAQNGVCRPVTSELACVPN